MKQNRIIILFFLTIYGISTAFGQSSEKEISVGFGGVSVVGTTLFGENVVEVGGLGGYFLNDKIYLGGGGFGMSSKGGERDISLGYGGMMLGYRWRGNKKSTSINSSVLGGYGAFSVKESAGEETNNNLWVIKPVLEIEFKLTGWTVVGIGGGYRWTLGNKLSTQNRQDLSSVFAGITLKFSNWDQFFRKTYK